MSSLAVGVGVGVSDCTSPESVAGTFTITASADVHGSISPAGSVVVAAGFGQQFDMTPDAGCMRAPFYVDGHSLPPGATYVFGNVTANHTIHATFANPIDHLIQVELNLPLHGSVTPPGPNVYVDDGQSGCVAGKNTKDGVAYACVGSAFTLSL